MHVHVHVRKRQFYPLDSTKSLSCNEAAVASYLVSPATSSFCLGAVVSVVKRELSIPKGIHAILAKEAVVVVSTDYTTDTQPVTHSCVRLRGVAVQCVSRKGTSASQT